MNIQQCDILNALAREPFVNQRLLAERCGHSLGVVNRSLRQLQQAGYLDEQVQLTEKARSELRAKAPKNAVILAAGFGMRMVPINTEVPKAFLKVKGELLIERLLRQLREAGIREIYIVVGFQKEQFEYLIDDYGVQLIVNGAYAAKNNLYSLALAAEHLSNTYVIPSDIWCAGNPFRENELYGWYMVSDHPDSESPVRVNRKMELVPTAEGCGGNAMVGIAYLPEEQAARVRFRLRAYSQTHRYDDAFWEETLYEQGKMCLPARVVPADSVAEINTYEQLRELDSQSDQLKSDAMTLICQALHAKKEEITHITVLKKGMTNRSFLFRCRNRQYIMRIPGEGTDRLINRRQEAAVYRAIQDQSICDDIVCLDPEKGWKITEYLENARVCRPENPDDVRRCMARLREFHERKLRVAHEFDLFGQLEFYEALWEGAPSVYRDYRQTKQKVLSLKPYLDACPVEKVLTHIDAVPDNFLFVEKDGSQEIRLIDWEYAGMQDPHVDIAMFCIYSLYDRNQAERLIDAYFPEGCEEKTRIKIYCYIAVCGLLWSNWCEYKRRLGVEFGEYSLRQYRYAKDYYQLAREAMEKEEAKNAHG